MDGKNEADGTLAEATLWFRKNDGAYEFNHVEDGHSASEKPAQKYPSQSGWAKGSWVKEHAWLDTSLPAKVVHDSQARLARMLATSAAAR